MSFDTVAKTAARAIVTTVGQTVTFRGCDDPVTTVGIVEKAVDLLGGQTPISDARWVVTLLVEDVGYPRRNDTVTDSDGTEWQLIEELPSTDKWITEWAARSTC